MIGNLSESAVDAMSIATAESQRFSQYYVGAEHLFIGLCKLGDPELERAFQEAGFDPVYWRRKVRAAISVAGASAVGENIDLTPRCKRVAKIAERIARRQSSDKVAPAHLFLALLAEGEGIPVRIMRENGFEVLRLGRALAREPVEPARPRPNARRFPFLESVGRDLTRLAAEGKLPPTIGREADMLKIAQSLRRKNKGNVLIVGDAGTGKSSLVYGFARMAASPEANEAIRRLHIFEVALSSLLAGTKFRGEFEERMKQLVAEAASDPDIVLFLDEFHLIKGAGASGDSMDVANLLKPALASGEIKCIAATTIDEFRRYIESDEALVRRFELLTLPEATTEETRAILEGVRPTFEAYHGVTVTDEALDAAVFLADRYISERRFPDKAIDLLDKACANAILDSIHARAPSVDKPSIDRTAISSALKQILQLPIPDDYLTENNRDLLMRLEERLREMVIGQDAAVATVTRAIQIHCAGLTGAEKPIGAFLFVGPTGVGKTELARAIAVHFFGTERKLLRFDMSEYAEPHTVSRLIGAPPGYVGSEDEGLLSKLVRSSPHSVILFDEIEKAHPDVLKIFLQILDPARLTDNHGRVVRFDNAIVIFTSNIGGALFAEAKKIGIPGRQALSQNVTPKVLAEVSRVISPELRNRLDEIVTFEPLEDKAILHRILDKLLREIRGLLSDRGMDMTVAPAALDVILAHGYNVEYGARHLKRTLDKMIKEPLALQMHSGAFGRGDVIRVGVTDGQLCFEKA
ncbi:MAG TPA: ATP-dependent Clp protease ATP-binding subunit [Chthonomonadaceae bacterium]|nr:ATP-dependent Clp protease ATP-binding subunit [Chthonomonadaceae bacterium]